MAMLRFRGSLTENLRQAVGEGRTGCHRSGTREISTAPSASCSTVARVYAGVAAARRREGRPITQAGCQIGAIAQACGMAVVIRNVWDFEVMGIEVLNPWMGL